MDRIFYFSGSGKSRRFAEFLGKKLDFPISDFTETTDFFVKTAIIVFPVYCQNLPDPVICFLKKLKAENIAFAAVYGRKSYGNVIEDAVKISSGNFIGGICVPCGHSFLSEPDDFDFESVLPFIERIKNPESAKTEHCPKDFYADLIPAKRTRIGVKIKRNGNCKNCGKCTENCPMGAIENGIIGKNCIRCLRCATECPENALEFKTLWFLKAYLVSGRKNEIKFYL
ncbi:MAG: hypothetical protein E7479_01235 [Ruminococcaceae bacterium]|nr:hypothetical protein [Oscillospiraceae bacterium]